MARQTSRQRIESCAWQSGRHAAAELANRIVGASDVGEGKARELINDIGLDYERLDQALPDSVKQQYNIDSLWSKDAGEILDRVIEGRVATDRIEHSSLPLDLMRSLISTANNTTIPRGSKNSGLNAHRLNTGYVKNYRPYQIRGSETTELGRTTTSCTRAYTGDMLERRRCSTSRWY